MAQAHAVQIPTDFNADIVAQHPIVRVYDIDGWQVAVSRHTDYNDDPCVTVTFNIAGPGGVLTAISPFPRTAEGSQDRDHLYRCLAGHPAAPEAVVNLVRECWQQDGHPSEAAKPLTAPAPDTVQ